MTADESTPGNGQESGASFEQVARSLASQRLDSLEADADEAFLEAYKRMKRGDELEDVLFDLISDLELVMVALEDMHDAVDAGDE